MATLRPIGYISEMKENKKIRKISKRMLFCDCLNDLVMFQER